jgi:hypothetical protein
MAVVDHAEMLTEHVAYEVQMLVATHLKLERRSWEDDFSWNFWACCKQSGALP